MREKELVPFGMMRRVAADLDRMFEGFGLGRWPATRFFRDFEPMAPEKWMPPVELLERDKQFVVRAELPGLEKKDVKVEVTRDAITIEGERKDEHEEKKEGFYSSERCYGSFFRRILIPEGVDVEKAKATFKNGVLEIVMPAPAREEPKVKKLEITEAAEPSKGTARTAA